MNMMPFRATVSRTNIATGLFAPNRSLKFFSPYSTVATGGSSPGTATVAASATSVTSRLRRDLSTQGSTALLRLQNALEEYRLREYQREVPSRFKKDIVRAAVASNVQTASKPSNCIRDATALPKPNPSQNHAAHHHRHHYQEDPDASNQQPFVALEGLYHVLTNIGADNKVSKMDLQTLFNEIGIHRADSSSSGDGDGQQYMVPARQLIQML